MASDYQKEKMLHKHFEPKLMLHEINNKQHLVIFTLIKYLDGIGYTINLVINLFRQNSWNTHSPLSYWSLLRVKSGLAMFITLERTWNVVQLPRAYQRGKTIPEMAIESIFGPQHQRPDWYIGNVFLWNPRTSFYAHRSDHNKNALNYWINILMVQMQILI